jgi:hypothetical protein
MFLTKTSGIAATDGAMTGVAIFAGLGATWGLTNGAARADEVRNIARSKKHPMFCTIFTLCISVSLRFVGLVVIRPSRRL